jgi:hypothetical protein
MGLLVTAFTLALGSWSSIVVADKCQQSDQLTGPTGGTTGVTGPTGGCGEEFIHFDRLDRSIFPQLADNIVALCVCVRIRGVGDLK